MTFFRMSENVIPLERRPYPGVLHNNGAVHVLLPADSTLYQLRRILPCGNTFRVLSAPSLEGDGTYTLQSGRLPSLPHCLKRHVSALMWTPLFFTTSATLVPAYLMPWRVSISKDSRALITKLSNRLHDKLKRNESVTFALTPGSCFGNGRR